MDKTKLKKFADLLVRVGGNVQKGQPVVISSDISSFEMARLVEDCAYDAGACEALIQWSDERSSHKWFMRADGRMFEEFPDWMVKRAAYNDDRKVAYLHVDSSDPELMKDVSPERQKKYMAVSSAAMTKHREMTMTNAVRWSVIGVPTPPWATKVFPGLSEDAAMAKLWDAIMEASRMNECDDPLEAWARHNANFKKRLEFMNGHDFKALHYKNAIGTDVMVGLPENHIWCGGGELAKDGVLFNPNIPSEEVFSCPMRDNVNGKMVASMPLSYQGKLIEDFEIEFKDGKAVSYKAGKNEEVLRNVIENDEGSCYLGEIALVGVSSPIYKMGVMFYDTLFDENAACHFALGKAYPINVKGGERMSNDELIKAGVNNSLTHVDFMVGTKDMSITGIKKDGTKVPVFVDGDFTV